MNARDVYTAIQRRARQEGRPTDELLTLYALERFLARLATTSFRHDFVLKGGVLLAAHGLRRPTRDIDMQDRDFPLDAQHLTAVTTAVADAGADDGLVLDGDAVTVEVIRDGVEYSGLRASVPATIWTHAFTLKLDVSTGDPMLPAPESIRLPTILGGEPITMLAHPLAMVVAEKTVTILQRGTTSTRWRDLVDIGSLARTQPFLAGDLTAAATAVSAHREVALGPIAPAVAGYGAVGQPRWAAWLRSRDLADLADRDLDGQVATLVDFIDPVYSGSLPPTARWDPDAASWSRAD